MTIHKLRSEMQQIDESGLQSILPRFDWTSGVYGIVAHRRYTAFLLGYGVANSADPWRTGCSESAAGWDWLHWLASIMLDDCTRRPIKRQHPDVL